MPKAHQLHLEWTPSRFITWAGTIGPQTAALVEAILADRPHPEQGYRSCLGILRLAKRDGDTRLEAACARAVAVGARSYRHVGNSRCQCATSSLRFSDKMRHLLSLLGRFSVGGLKDRRGASWGWEADSRLIGRAAEGLGGSRSDDQGREPRV